MRSSPKSDTPLADSYFMAAISPVRGAHRLRVWIDLSNSPHPLLFAPIARALEQRGHAVSITARDHAQTVELARSGGLDVDVIGGESPGGRARKASALGGRVIAL